MYWWQYSSSAVPPAPPLRAAPPEPTQLALAADEAILRWPAAVAARAPAWANAHGLRLRALLGTSPEANTVVRVSVTSLAANSARGYSGLIRQFVDFCRIREYLPTYLPTYQASLCVTKTL